MGKSSFQALINSEKPVLIDFYADWCGPCKAFAPVLKEIKKEVGDQVKVVKINVDNNPAISQQLEIRSIPTLMIFKKGNVVWRVAGAQSKTAVLRKLDEAIKQ
jgi:thioredoxin 1